MLRFWFNLWWFIAEKESADCAAFILPQLTSFRTCNHIQQPRMCSSCAHRLVNVSKMSENHLYSVSTILRAVAEASITNSCSNLRTLVRSIEIVLRRSIVIRRQYLEKLDIKQSTERMKYTTQHRYGPGLTIPRKDSWIDKAIRTGELFPRRPEIRPRIHFGTTSRKENLLSCRKNYSMSDAHSPGIFTAQYICEHPRLMGLSVMLECEGISTALSVLQSRFKTLPKVTYYGNACNMGKSVVLRLPWINDETTIVCDLFHYKSHSCNSISDPDSYPACNNHSKSGAESINHLWSISRTHYDTYILIIYCPSLQ